MGIEFNFLKMVENYWKILYKIAEILDIEVKGLLIEGNIFGKESKMKRKMTVIFNLTIKK